MSYVPMSRDSGRTVVLVAYVLHLVGAVTGLISIIGVIVNYVCAGRDGELSNSHHRWMIRSFWWGLFWTLVGFVFWLVGLGWLIWLIVWAWYVYRHVRGLVALVNGEPMPR